MVDLIRIAWDVNANNIVGGPNWLATDRFDIVATTPERAAPEEANLMLRKLLAERVGLVVRPDTRPVPVFAMTVAKGGTKIKKAASHGQSGCVRRNSGTAQQEGPAWNEYSCLGMTLPAFAESLPGLAPAYFLGNQLLVDQTGLAGIWDFEFRFTPPGQGAAGQGLTLFQAVEKDLGLQIASARVPQPVIVVDSVNRTPTPNEPGVSEKLKQASEFEVAVLRPSAPGATQPNISLQGKVELRNLPLRNLIVVAWNLTNDKIVGIPEFANTDRYDILASPPAWADTGVDSLRAMLRTLLKERFKMTFHNDEVPVDVYSLEASKPKLKKAEPGNRSECVNVAATSAALLRAISCQNTTMEQFTVALKRMAGGYFSQRAVVDATGIEGEWDFTLNFSPAGALQTGPAGTAADPNGAVSIFEAIDKQLGLKLETRKRAMPVLVIDHIEKKPLDN